MSKGKWFLIAVAALAVAYAVAPKPDHDAQEACIDRIEATNAAAGVATDYNRAYVLCR